MMMAVPSVAAPLDDVLAHIIMVAMVAAHDDVIMVAVMIPVHMPVMPGTAIAAGLEF